MGESAGDEDQRNSILEVNTHNVILAVTTLGVRLACSLFFTVF